jgi:hypothetical protein
VAFVAAPPTVVERLANGLDSDTNRYRNLLASLDSIPITAGESTGEPKAVEDVGALGNKVKDD